MHFDLIALGDSALTIRVGSTVDEPTRLRVQGATRAIRGAIASGIIDIVPGYTTVTVHYNPILLASERLERAVGIALASAAVVTTDEGHLIAIPVCYGGDFGPDLEDVARHTALTPGEVISRHAAHDYRVRILGFLPGFAYISGLDPALESPRRSTPREKVAAGSVGIAGMQTGVYPLDSPGGWQLIGKSPSCMFDPAQSPPTLLLPGDRVRFVPIDRAEFDRLATPHE